MGRGGQTTEGQILDNETKRILVVLCDTLQEWAVHGRKLKQQMLTALLLQTHARLSLQRTKEGSKNVYCGEHMTVFEGAARPLGRRRRCQVHVNRKRGRSQPRDCTTILSSSVRTASCSVHAASGFRNRISDSHS